MVSSPGHVSGSGQRPVLPPRFEEDRLSSLSALPTLLSDEQNAIVQHNLQVLQTSHPHFNDAQLKRGLKECLRDIARIISQAPSPEAISSREATPIESNQPCVASFYIEEPSLDQMASNLQPPATIDFSDESILSLQMSDSVAFFQQDQELSNLSMITDISSYPLSTAQCSQTSLSEDSASSHSLSSSPPPHSYQIEPLSSSLPPHSYQIEPSSSSSVPTALVPATTLPELTASRRSNMASDNALKDFMKASNIVNAIKTIDLLHKESFSNSKPAFSNTLNQAATIEWETLIFKALSHDQSIASHRRRQHVTCAQAVELMRARSIGKRCKITNQVLEANLHQFKARHKLELKHEFPKTARDNMARNIHRWNVLIESLGWGEHYNYGLAVLLPDSWRWTTRGPKGSKSIYVTLRQLPNLGRQLSQHTQFRRLCLTLNGYALAIISDDSSHLSQLPELALFNRISTIDQDSQDFFSLFKRGELEQLLV